MYVFVYIHLYIYIYTYTYVVKCLATQNIFTDSTTFARALQQLALLLRLLRAGGAQRGDGGADGADEGREDAHGEPRLTEKPRT